MTTIPTDRLRSTPDVDTTLLLPIGHLIEQALTSPQIRIVAGISAIVCGAARSEY